MDTYISAWPDKNLPEFPRKLVILGATGSIGASALKVVDSHPDKFPVLGLAGGRNARLLAQLAAKYRPKYLGVLGPDQEKELRSLLPSGYDPVILTGPEGYMEMAALDEADMVLSSIVGAAGFMPTLAAAKAGKAIALANKESLVLGGHIIRKVCRETGAVILPVDSEHNALFQAMHGHEPKHISYLILTASGGPFRTRDMDFLKTVTPDQALKHPNWSMGAKISIDSATLMNKGLEFIEACHLYGTGPDRIKVVVHPQSIVHSLVEYMDGSILGHLGVPDMQIPIAHCMCFPERVNLALKPLSLAETGTLTFEKPDLKRFPCLGLAKEAFEAGQSHQVVLNAANEVAVDKFLKNEIKFLDIPKIIDSALSDHISITIDDPEDVISLDGESRAKILENIGNYTT